MRVRLFELRLLAVALTLLWAAGGGIVLIAYRPGGPLDVLVGVAASLPFLVSVAAIVWPDEIDVTEGRISIDSPVGQALLHKKLDDEVIVRKPGGEITLYITGISSTKPEL